MTLKEPKKVHWNPSNLRTWVPLTINSQYTVLWPTIEQPWPALNGVVGRACTMALCSTTSMAENRRYRRSIKQITVAHMGTVTMIMCVGHECCTYMNKHRHAVFQLYTNAMNYHCIVFQFFYHTSVGYRGLLCFIDTFSHMVFFFSNITSAAGSLKVRALGQ